LITRPSLIFGANDLHDNFPYYSIGIIAGIVISIETSLTNTSLKLLKDVRAEISSLFAALFTLLIGTLGLFGAFGEVQNKMGWDQLKIVLLLSMFYTIGFLSRPKAMQNIELR